MRYEYPLAIKHSNGRFPIYRLLFPSKPPCLIPGGIWRVLFSDKTRSSLVSLMATCLKAAWLFEWKSGRLSTESSLSALRIFSPSNLRNKDFKKQKHEQASKIHLRVRKNIQISALTNMSPTFPYRKHLAFFGFAEPFIAIHRHSSSHASWVQGLHVLAYWSPAHFHSWTLAPSKPLLPSTTCGCKDRIFPESLGKKNPILVGKWSGITSPQNCGFKPSVPIFGYKSHHFCWSRIF